MAVWTDDIRFFHGTKMAPYRGFSSPEALLNRLLQSLLVRVCINKS
jgi:hypothetical protein